MVKTKFSDDYTATTVTVYNVLTAKYGWTARITDIWPLLRDAFGLEEFEILDTNVIANSPFQSYLIDKQIAWQEGKEVDFKEISDAVISTGEFSMREKRTFIDGNIEERLWAIMLAITDPGKKLIIKDLN